MAFWRKNRDFSRFRLQKCEFKKSVKYRFLLGLTVIRNLRLRSSAAAPGRASRPHTEFIPIHQRVSLGSRFRKALFHTIAS